MDDTSKTAGRVFPTHSLCPAIDMGSDGTIFIFDDAAFKNDVVPALVQLVHNGARPPWLSDLFIEMERGGVASDLSLFEKRGFLFDQVCGYLDFGFAYRPQSADSWSDAWSRRACTSSHCPARRVCPLHQNATGGAAEEFNSLFDACVVQRTLSEGIFLGRSVGPLWYVEELAEMGIDPGNEIHTWLRELEFRGYVIGYRWANSDGIHGWLYADETKRFVNLLDELDLPDLEPSLAGLRALYHPGGRYRIPAGMTFRRLSLSVFRTVARLAVAESKGILWGNDVCPFWIDLTT